MDIRCFDDTPERITEAELFILFYYYYHDMDYGT